MAENLSYSIEEREGAKIINLRGGIHILSKEDLAELVNKTSQKSNVILNLREVELLTSSGINTLVEISNEARKNSRRVVILGLKEEFIKIIDGLDLYEYFIFVDSIEEGLMKLKFFT